MKKILKKMMFILLPLCLILSSSVNVVKAVVTDITFTIYSPYKTTVAYDNCYIEIRNLKSTYQISEVKAKIDNKELNLNYNKTTERWTGNIDMSGLKKGIQTLQVTAVDIYGNKETKSTTFHYSQIPNLKVISVDKSDVAVNYYDIIAEASDSEGEDCKIEVYCNGKKVSEALNKINTAIDLNYYFYADFNRYLRDKSIKIQIIVSNETGGKYSTERIIYPEQSNLIEIKQIVDGEILDYNYDKILFKTKDGKTKLKDLKTNVEELIFTDSQEKFEYGYVTTGGVMFVVSSPNNYLIYEYKDSNIKYVGRLYRYYYVSFDFTFKVNGNYAAWRGDAKPKDSEDRCSGDSIFIKDLSNDTVNLVTDQAFEEGTYELTSNGDVLFHFNTYGDDRHFDIYKYNKGKTDRLSSDTLKYRPSDEAGVWPLEIVSDGTTTLYDNISMWDPYMILNKDGQDKQTFYTSGGKFGIINDSIVYSKEVNRVTNVFLWKDGTEKQVTFNRSDTTYYDYGSNGELILSNDGQHYSLVKPDGSQVNDSFKLRYKIYRVNGGTFGVKGNTLVEIKTTPIDTAAPNKPIIKEINNSYTVISGTAEANSYIEAKVDDKLIGITKASENGTYKISIPPQSVNSTILLTSNDKYRNSSAAVPIVVKDNTAPKSPIVNELTNKGKEITGYAEPNTLVIVKIGNQQYSSKATEKGRFKVVIPIQNAGKYISVTSKDNSGNISNPTFVKVKKVAPNVPYVNPVKSSSSKLIGKADKNVTVVVSIGNKKYTTKASSTGNFVVKIPKLKVGTKVYINAKDSKGILSATKLTIVLK